MPDDDVASGSQDNDPPALLVIRDLKKSYGGAHALKGVSFDVSAGEVHALLGENGAGKSTLVKILAGAERPDGGSLRFAGELLDHLTPREAQLRGIAVVHQELSLVPDLTVLENLFLGRERRQRRFCVDRGTSRRLAHAVSERMGVPLTLDAPVVSLSVAERQRVEIARALAFDARIIIMDEPSAVLAGEELTQLFRIVKSLRDQGVTIIYISHRLAEIRHLADRVTVLKDGRHVATRELEGLTEPQLVRLMVGRDLEPAKARSPSVGATALELHNLQLHAGTRPFSLRVSSGEVVGLAGLVGSGRTSVANVLAGLFKPYAGRIERAGEPVKLLTPRHAIAARIAVVPEDRRQQGLLLPLSMTQNVALPNLAKLSRLGLMRPRREKKLAQTVVHDLDIRPPDPAMVVGLLSGGNQQKVVLGKWLVQEPAPELFVFDEPTRGVDVGAKVEVHRVIAELAERGAAVLLISSELQEVIACSHRVVVMREGTVAGELSAPDVTEEAIMQLAVGEASVTTPSGVAL